MKLAIIGSRDISDYPLERVIPTETTEIITGGARGADTLARQYALSHGIPLVEFLPDYGRFGRAAPIRRNDLIIARADVVLALWDGRSPGTRYVIDTCRRLGKPVIVLP